MTRLGSVVRGVIYQENPKYQDMPRPLEDDIAREGKAKPRLDFSKTNLFPAAAVVTNQVADSILADNPYLLAIAIGFNQIEWILGECKQDT